MQARKIISVYNFISNFELKSVKFKTINLPN